MDYDSFKKTYDKMMRGKYTKLLKSNNSLECDSCRRLVPIEYFDLDDHTMPGDPIECQKCIHEGFDSMEEIDFDKKSTHDDVGNKNWVFKAPKHPKKS